MGVPGGRVASIRRTPVASGSIDLRERLLAGAIATVFVAGVAAMFVADISGTLDADAAARCAANIADELHLGPNVAPVVRPRTIEEPGGSELEVWAVSVPATGYVLELLIAPGGEVRDARGVAPGGADPIARDDLLAARRTRCQT